MRLHPPLKDEIARQEAVTSIDDGEVLFPGDSYQALEIRDDIDAFFTDG
jgi:hypothetical protein